MICLMAADSAYAYIDLGTGSYIIQIAIATLLGALFTLKTFWGKVKEFFKRLFSANKREKR